VEWSTACLDWESRIVAGKSLISFDPLFPEEADAAMLVFDDLLIVDAPGSPRMGDAARPWVRDFAKAIFGSYDSEVGRRLIAEYFLLISKKNAKSTTAAGIMLTALIRNWRESGEFGILAPTMEAANNAFRPARDMIRRDEELSDLLHVQDHIRTITHRQNGGTLQVVAADSDTVTGKKWIGTFVDELWAFGKKPGAADMLLEATGGMASRPEGFVIYASTHSNEAPAGVFKQKLEYARRVRDGKVSDNAFLPVLYEFPPAMIKSGACRDIKNFYVTNPNLGASVDEAFHARKYQEAQDGGEETIRGFLAKFANVEVGLHLRSDRWAGANFWERQARPGLTLDELIRRCEVLDIGIDGGGLDDLLGLAVAGREAETGKWLAWTHAWAHPSVLELRKSEVTQMNGFRDDGDLTFVEMIGEDVTELAEICARVEASKKLDKIGVDPHGLGGILDALIALKIPEDKIIGVSQGWKMAGAIKTAERKLAEGALIHGGQRMMNWCCGNARIVLTGNAVLITKQASGTAKIDPLMALMDAVTLLSLNPVAPKPPQFQMFSIGA
jgi:phage terminase large subunit-like protein